MVNLMLSYISLLNGLLKVLGIRSTTVEIEPGTSMTLWVPSETLKKKNIEKPNKKSKPAVVLIHGFAANGIVTWQLQVAALTKKYDVYVPDLLFFGESTTGSSDRSPGFQAECLAVALGKLGVRRCTLVGFSYGGLVAYKMAELRPDLVEALVVSGLTLPMPEAIFDAEVKRMGFNSLAHLLLPTSVDGTKGMLKVGAFRKLWLPDRFHSDYVKAMVTNRKEKSELLDGLMIAFKDPFTPHSSQKLHLLWGENDQVVRSDFALKMRENFGENVTYEGIKRAGHLVQVDRPFVYNASLKRFLASIYEPSK